MKNFFLQIAFFCCLFCVAQNDRLTENAQKIKVFCKQNPKYNNEVVFLLDMKIASNKNRFFAYNLKNNEIIAKGLVAHGSGSETGELGKLKFSNVKNSLSTSLGTYWIGISYNGSFGKAYKLYGLDKTNSNAYPRNIVFHSYFDVPKEEQLTPICNSLGCPMVNKLFFKEMEKIIDASKKPILMLLYY